MKIICVGSCAYDITYILDSFPKENTKNRVNEQIKCGGGPASNAAYLLGKWGMDTSFIGVVGTDTYADLIIDEFKSVNVDTSYVTKIPDLETPVACIIVNKENGSRTVFTHRDDKLKMPLITLPFTPDVILLDGQEYELSLSLLEKYKNSITIIDAGRPKENVIDLAKKVKYLVCSKEFAETVTNIKIDYENKKTIVELYKKMEEMFNNTIVVTLEDKGCLYRFEGKIKIMPSIKVNAVDSTGAGDLFHGAFTYAISNNYNLEEAVRLSNITGALSVTKAGGRYSVYPFEEVKKIYENSK